MDPDNKPKPEALLQSRDDTKRPLIHHLNADTSWLIQLPRDGPRPYLNLLIDPWLTGSQEEFSALMHTQSHTIEAAYQSIAEIEAFVQSIEERANALRGESIEDSSKPVSFIDAVACSFYGTDHVHEPTLRQLHHSVPIFLASQSVNRVRGWKYFDTVVQHEKFVDDWRKTSKSPLPDWLGLGFVEQKWDLQTIHKGLVVSFDIGSGPEAIIYMPHGIPVEELAFIPKVAPDLRVLAMLHGLLRLKVGVSWIGHSDANLGAHNGLKAQRLFDARYWIGTHDEYKQEAGLTHYLLTKVPLTLEDALEEERRQAESETYVERPANWHPLGNGDGMVLA